MRPKKCPPPTQTNNNNCCVCERSGWKLSHIVNVWNRIATDCDLHSPYRNHACNALSKLYYCDRVIRIAFGPTACVRQRRRRRRPPRHANKSVPVTCRLLEKCNHVPSFRAQHNSTKLFNASRVCAMTTTNGTTNYRSHNKR